MKTSNISFGAKIPVGTCQVHNKITKQQSLATIYEFDCKDSSDIAYYMRLPGRWKYGKSIADDVEMRYFYPKQFSNSKFIAIEDGFNRPLGIMEYMEFDNSNDVKLIETHFKDRYKYIGTNLLAHAAKETLKTNRDTLVVCDPIPAALDFYIKKCGFERIQGTPELGLDKDGMRNLIEKSQHIDLYV